MELSVITLFLKLLITYFQSPISYVVLTLVAITIFWKKKRDYRKASILSNLDTAKGITKALINKDIFENPYLLEQHFLIRHGALLNSREIKYFLNKINPTELVTDYIQARNIIHFTPRYNNLTFKKRWHTPKYLQWVAFIATILSIVFLLAGVFCFWVSLNELVIQSEASSIVLFAVLSLASCFYARVAFEVVVSNEAALRIVRKVGLTSTDSETT